MFSISWGVFFSLLLCTSLIGAIVKERDQLWVPLIILTILVTAGGCIGGFIGWHCSRQWYDGYAAQKHTIEAGLSVPGLSEHGCGVLAKKAGELNGNLAKRLYDARQWYGFLDDPRILDAEPVRLTMAEESDV